MVQLHGSEPAHFSSFIPVPTIRVIHAQVDDTADSISKMARPGMHQFVLLEAVKPGEKVSGGSGVTVNLDLAKEVIEKGEAGGNSPLPIILAGGLTPDTVGKVVKSVQPWAVDVSGGVETDGKKDPAKIRKFIDVVKAVQ
ncbi:bifunctional tryptophan synthase trp1 [Serendipita sp. 401]|nr:bifunctional tryptophan synthase trp1 [Serendipita sp. 401]